MKRLVATFTLLIARAGLAGSDFRFPCIEFANQQLSKVEMGTYDKPKGEVSKFVDYDHVLFQLPGVLIRFGFVDRKRDIVAQIRTKNPLSGDTNELRYRLKDTGNTCEVESIGGQPWIPFTLNSEVCTFVRAAKFPDKLNKADLKRVLNDSGRKPSKEDFDKAISICEKLKLGNNVPQAGKTPDISSH